jgi:ABC-type polar amino acid transport system ATPase subunit
MSINGSRYKFNQKNVDKSPTKAGVFALYEGGKIILIGQASGGKTTVRTCLQGLHAGKDNNGIAQATHYRREVTSSPAKREKELLDEYREKKGTLPRCNAETK